MGPARRVPNDGVMQKALHQINTNTVTSSAALDNVIHETVAERNHGVTGYLLETTSPSYLRFDPMFLSAATLDVEVGVTHYRAPGAAWAQYVVLFVVVDHGAQTKLAKQQQRRNF